MLDFSGFIVYIIDNKEKEKEITKMTINELKAQLEKVQNRLFMEQMADFMNWTLYHQLRREERELLDQIKALEG